MALFGKKTKDKTKPQPEKAEAKSMKELYGAATAGKAKEVKQGETRAAHSNAYKILVKPLVTEKVSNLGALNQYVFAVALKTNKIEVAKAVKEVYGIKPVSVNMIKMAGKKARYGRISGRRKDWKKAIVTLPSGQTIKIYEGV